MNKGAANGVFIATLLITALAAAVFGINRQLRHRSGRNPADANIQSDSRPAAPGSRTSPNSRGENQTRVQHLTARSQSAPNRSPAATSSTISDVEGHAAAVDDLVASRTKRLADLSEQLRKNPESVRQLFDLMRSETDPEMIAMLAEVIAENAAIIGANMPVDDLLKMAQGDKLAMRRAAALRILGKATNVTPDIMRAVFEISQADDNKEMRISAICASSFWMKQYPQQKDLMYAELLKTKDTAPDPEVRGFAIQTVAMQGDPLQGELLNAVTETLRSDESSMNRNLAALGLALGARADTQVQVITELESAYNRETNLESKRIMMTQIVRTGMAQSADILARLDISDPQLRQDATEWTQLLQGNPADFDRIWDEKARLDGARGTPIGGTDQQ